MSYLLQLHSLLVILQFILQSSGQVFYITPDPVHTVSCSEANTTLNPCYTLDELDETVLCHRHSVLLFFLPGKHVVSQPFLVNTTQNLIFSSWNERHGVVIECVKLTGPNFNLTDIAFIDITAIKFSYCSMKIWNQQGELDGTDHNVTGTLEVTNSMFAFGTNVLDLGNLVSIFIVNSTFASNNGAISCCSTTPLVNTELLLFNSTFVGNNGKQTNSLIIIGESNKRGWLFVRRRNTEKIYVNAFIKVDQMNHVVIRNCIFNSNHGSVFFAALNVMTRVVMFRSSFLNNDGLNPAIYINNINLSLIKSTLTNNTGSAIYAESSHIYINDTSIKYNQGYRGALALYSCSISICNSSLVGNKANTSGGAIYFEGGNILSSVDSRFVGNIAKIHGGAIYLQNSYASVLRSKFVNNSALQSGGSLYLTWSETPLAYYAYSSVNITNTLFLYSKAEVSGGALYCTSNIVHKILMNNVIGFSNSVNLRGGFLLLIKCNVSLKGRVILNYNTANQGGAIYAQTTSAINFRRGTIFVSHNSAEQDGGAVYADASSDPTFNCSVVTFSHNTAKQNGGALYLQDSTFTTYRCQRDYSKIITFKNNTAVLGGAIFIPSNDCENRGIKSECPIQFLGWNNYLLKHIKKIMIFSYNEASQGSVIYGGLLDRCSIPTVFFRSPTVGIDFIRSVSQYELLPLAISSDPIKVCSLNLTNLEPNCRSNITSTKMRGEAVRVFLALTDQDGNPVTGIVRARYKELSAQLGQGEVKRELPGGNYTELAFHVYTENSKATLVLSPDGICSNSNLSIITVNITIAPCVRGFEQNKDRCVCDGRLRLHFNITSCNIDTRELTKRGEVWLSLDEDLLKAHGNCPLGYCQASVNTIRLDSADEQCVNGRGGILCGECKDNLSIALGSHHCIQCPLNYNFVWLTVIFALAGIGLVAFLLTLNLTISSGTINGLVFYANVVSLSGLLSLRSCYLHPILSVFIAWINLDWGIEICFYPGMNTYQKTWLQFVFPLYVWLLVTVIIVASHYSSRAMKLFGRNNIAILATLFLLSYSKLLKTIITALTFTDILTSPADNVTAPMLPHRVWTYNANIDYLQGKHVYLFAVAMLALLLLFLPYTLLLTFRQCVRSMPARKKWVSCFTRSAVFISILDAYHAPYNRKHRYWTGLMLLTRCLLFLVFATNIGSDPILTNMYVIILVILAVLTIKLFAKKIHKVAWVGIIELCYLLNLAVLSGTLHYQKGKDSDDKATCTTITASLSISFILFGPIVGYHAFLRLSKKRWYILVHSKVLYWWQHRHEKLSRVSSAASCKPHNAPTMTQLELRESLLESVN